jgi:phage I-like protein
MDKIRKALKLSDDASEADIVTAIHQLALGGREAAELRTELLRVQTLHAGEREAHAATKAALAAIEAKRAADQAAQLDAAIDALLARARREGRIRPRQDADGMVVETAVEKAIATMARTAGLEAATAYVNDLPQVDPISRVQTAGATAAPAAAPRALSAVEESVRKQLGLSVEQWHDANPPKTA